VSIT
jgi:hypothetical protein